jgi:hypothetical protein
MMSRGKVGSIFIDNGLSDIIGKNKESFSKELAPNLRAAIGPFIDAKLSTLNSLELVPNDTFDAAINPTEKKEPKKEAKKPSEPEEIPEQNSVIIQDNSNGLFGHSN